MVNKMSPKGRKKWNRRILIATSLRDITLTRVKRNNADLWVSTADIQDHWKERYPTARHKSMSSSELDNRFKHIAAQSFMESRFVNGTAITLGNSRVQRIRVRRMQYQLTDLEAVEDYLALCKATLLEN
jgi:hypothetical protein